jgi:adenylate kinase family enzyme
MTRRLIIIRGNSGSGKSTIAMRLRNALPDRTMLLSQDVLRRDILKVHDTAGNSATGLIKQMAGYGRDNGYDVIIEGILSEVKYGEMLRSLTSQFEESHVYYMEIPFDETLRRHISKPNAHEFGEKEMREWWKEKDYLNLPGETIIDHLMSEEQILRMMLDDTR